MFYDIYKKLCEEHGESPYALPLKLGAKSNSIVAQWKKGSIPRPDMLKKIADYFGVTSGYLLDGNIHSTNSYVRRGFLEDNKTLKMELGAFSGEEKEKPVTESDEPDDEAYHEIKAMILDEDADGRAEILRAIKLLKSMRE